MVKKIILLILLVNTSIFAASFYENEMGKGYYQYHTESKPAGKGKQSHILPDNEALLSMPAQEFKQLVTDTLNHALTVRNLDTYGEYARIQQIALQRVNEFTALQVLYAQLHPPADENVANRRLYEQQSSDTIRTYLRNNRSEYGLLYFYSPECSYCMQQTPLLMSFQEQYEWEIEAINILDKPHLAAQFNVTVTPSIRLVDRNKNIMPVSNGLIALPELEERAYRFIRYLKGDTNDLNFDAILR